MCALALLEATAPIRAADFRDGAALLKYAGERLQLIEAVLASPHVIEDAPQLASVRDLQRVQTDAQGVFVNFAGDMLERYSIAKLPKPRRRSRWLAAKRFTVRWSRRLSELGSSQASLSTALHSWLTG